MSLQLQQIRVLSTFLMRIRICACICIYLISTCNDINFLNAIYINIKLQAALSQFVN